MYVLGINSLFHESAACLLHDGLVVAFAEEERFNRVKHAKTPRVETPDQLPLHAMHYCLQTAGITLADVQHIGYSSNPEARRRFELSGQSGHCPFADNTERVPQVLSTLGFQGEFAWIDHHLAHAASAYYSSPFEAAAVLAIDGIGDDKTTASYFGQGTGLTLVDSILPPHSIGFLWELVSMFLGFDIYDATKIMGLAAYGDPARFADQFARLMTTHPDGSFRINEDATRFYELDYLTPTGYFAGLEQLFGVPRRQGGELTQVYMDISAALQEATDRVALHMIRHLHEKTGSRNLCLAGGVALNCVTNTRVFEQGPFDQMFIQPAAHDAGTAIGCTTYLWHHILKRSERDTMTHAYWGPEFSTDQIESVLKQRGLVYERRECIEADVARLIADGQVIGFFQGRMEIGPRALGNRSLLADPRNPNMREVLNHKVKHREYFRPFAPSVIAEEAHTWFQIGKETSAARFMLMAHSVPGDLRARIPAVIHQDGTSRVQVVERQTNPRFHRLISEFHQLTGVPIVLNTSFNDSEPIVCSPDDAVETFLKTRIDYLAIGDFLVSKQDNLAAESESHATVPDLSRLCPAVHRSLDRVLNSRRLSRIDGFHLITDSSACSFPDPVQAILPEHQFFIDEIPRDRIQSARVLEVGLGAGLLSIAAIRAGASSSVGLETNPRARALAGFNIVLCGCDDRIEIREGSEDPFQPVQGRAFDYVISNPPYLPGSPATKSSSHPAAAALLGMEALDKFLAGLDAHLSETGLAQFISISPGSARDPFPLRERLLRLLKGRSTILVNPVPDDFHDSIDWQLRSGTLTARQATEMHRSAQRLGLTHLHLCMVHYEKCGPHEVQTRNSAKSYPHWHLPYPGLEQL